jgi:hypothetical protein
MRLISWKPITKGSLRGFVAVELPIRLKIHDVPVLTYWGIPDFLHQTPQFYREGCARRRHLPDHQHVRRAAHGGARFCVGNPSALRRSDRLPAILALIAGQIGLVEVCRDSLFRKELKRPAPKPVLAIIGDDDHRSTGPAGFPAAERFGHWALRCNCPRRRRRGRALRQGGPHRTDRSPRVVDPRDGMHPILPGRKKLQ